MKCVELRRVHALRGSLGKAILDVGCLRFIFHFLYVSSLYCKAICPLLYTYPAEAEVERHGRIDLQIQAGDSVVCCIERSDLCDDGLCDERSYKCTDPVSLCNRRIERACIDQPGTLVQGFLFCFLSFFRQCYVLFSFLF